MQEASLMFRTLASLMKASEDINRSKDDGNVLAHSLSLLWKELVIIADRSVYDYKKRYD